MKKRKSIFGYKSNINGNKFSKKSNPMSINVCGIFSKIKKLLKPNIIFLHCSKGVIPRFYGLPKVYKVSVSLRPIVYLINSPTTICQNFYLVFCLAYQ